jgi:hypothetical protein
VATAAFEELPFALTWVSEERLPRTSHALADGGRVWLVDPVDAAGAVARAQALGEPAAVIQLLERHNRDCAAIAARLGVPHLYVPDAVPDSPFDVIDVVSWPAWHERALWWPRHRTLVVAEAVGTSEAFTAGLAPVGVHAFLRPLPPRALRDIAPEHLLVGHGPSVHGDAARSGLDQALRRARRDLPRFAARLPALLRG